MNLDLNKKGLYKISNQIILIKTILKLLLTKLKKI
jgi:hypothetical protein